MKHIRRDLNSSILIYRSYAKNYRHNMSIVTFLKSNYKYKRRTTEQHHTCNKKRQQWNLPFGQPKQKHKLPANVEASTDDVDDKQITKRIPFYENIKFNKFLRILILIMQQATPTNMSGQYNNVSLSSRLVVTRIVAKMKAIRNANNKSLPNVVEYKDGINENYRAYKDANKDTDFNVDISNIADEISHQQHNYDKVSTNISTPIKCQRRNHHQIKATTNLLSSSSQTTSLSSSSSTSSISMATSTATLTITTLISSLSMKVNYGYQWSAILRHYVGEVPSIHYQQYHRKHTQLHPHHHHHPHAFHIKQLPTISSSSKVLNDHYNSRSNFNGSTSSGTALTGIYQSVYQYVTAVANRSYTLSCFLLTLFIAFSIGVQSASAGACWQTVLDNGKCNEIFSLNISKSECCGANQEFAYTEREPTNVEYFFATAIGGGMECSPCLESCRNVKCGSNKKCVKRKGRPKCICAPECGAARRKRKQRENLMQQEQQHHTSSLFMNDNNNNEDDDGGGGDGYFSEVSNAFRSPNAFKIKIEKPQQQSRDTRSLSSEITNVNLGLENDKDAMIRSGATSPIELHHCKEHNQNQRKFLHTHTHHSHGQGPKQQQQHYTHQIQQQSNHKNQEPKASRRLLITANVEHTEKPTTRRLQIFSNVKATHARRHNNNNSNNHNRYNNRHGRHEDTDPSDYDEEDDEDYDYNDAEDDAKGDRKKTNSNTGQGSNRNNRNDDSTRFLNQSSSRHKLKTNKKTNNNNKSDSNSNSSKNKNPHDLQTTKIQQHSSNSNNNNNTRVRHSQQNGRHAENTPHHRHHNHQIHNNHSHHHHRQQEQEQQHRHHNHHLQQQQQQQQQRNQNKGRRKHNNRNKQNHKQQTIVVKKPKNNKDYNTTAITTTTTTTTATSNTSNNSKTISSLNITITKSNNPSDGNTDAIATDASSINLQQAGIVKTATIETTLNLSSPSAADPQLLLPSSAISSLAPTTPVNSTMSADDGAAADDHYHRRLPNHGSKIATSSLSTTSASSLPPSSSSSSLLPSPPPPSSSHSQQSTVSAPSSSESAVATMSAKGEDVVVSHHDHKHRMQIPTKTVFINNKNNNNSNNNNSHIISKFQSNLHNNLQQQQQQDQQQQTQTQTQQSRNHYQTPLFDGISEQFDLIGFPNKQQQQVTSGDNVRPLNPVCGTDGRTYNTECQLRKRACRTDNPNLQISYRGHCRTTCNGVKCLNGLTCVEDQNLMPHCIACKIECPQDDYDNDVVDATRAVCGADGKTYKSACDINRMICKIGRSIGVAYPGPCRENQITCDDVNCGPKQVCLIDLLTHKPRCTSCRYKCSRKRHPPLFSHFEEGKICGLNNRTYNSWCEMRKDSCSTGFYIDVKYSGDCH